jgi:hypothetical protein
MLNSSHQLTHYSLETCYDVVEHELSTELITLGFTLVTYLVKDRSRGYVGIKTSVY